VVVVVVVMCEKKVVLADEDVGGCEWPEHQDVHMLT
jgi:hypothetical protein